MAMVNINWDVTYFCPLQCHYCYSNSGPSQPLRNDPDELLAVAHAIAREKPSSVFISGGEPALVKGITEVGEILRSAGIWCEIFTSGWALDDRRAESLCGAFDSIHVSIDAPTAEVNDAIRGKAGAHRHAVRALEILSRRKALKTPEQRMPQFGVDCTVVRSNLTEVAGLCAFVAGAFENIDFINVGAAVPSGRASSVQYAATEVLDEADITQLVKMAARIRTLIPRSVRLCVTDNTELRKNDDVHVQVNPAGDVRAMKVCEKTVGNIVKEPLQVILERATRWRDRSLLARQLRTAKDFVKWADAVRRIDETQADEGEPTPESREVSSH